MLETGKIKRFSLNLSDHIKISYAKHYAVPSSAGMTAGLKIPTKKIDSALSPPAS